MTEKIKAATSSENDSLYFRLKNTSFSRNNQILNKDFYPNYCIIVSSLSLIAAPESYFIPNQNKHD